MTIGDVLELPQFVNNLSALLNKAKHERQMAREEANERGNTLCAHPLDRIPEKAEDVKVLYAEVLNKVSRLPRAQRDIILWFGTTAFKVTMQDLIKREKETENQTNNKEEKK